MPKMTSEEIDEIVKKDLPDYHVAKQIGHSAAHDSVSRPRVEGSTPDIQALRRKYLPQEYRNRVTSATDSPPNVGDAGLGSSAGSDEKPDDEIIAVTPNVSADPWDRSARPKAAVISGADKKVIGQQG